MICDICVEDNVEDKGAYVIEGHTVCNPCLVKALVFYCKCHGKSVKVAEPSESVKEAWKEDKTRGWWA